MLPVPRPAAMRNAGNDHGVVKIRPARDTQAPVVVQERTLAALGGVKIAAGWIVNQPRDQFAVALERDGDRK